jgi:Ca-activated chloride channel family protein
MSFLAGEWLWCLAFLPLLAGACVLLERRRKRWFVRHSSLAQVRDAQAAASRWRRRVPGALLLAGVATLVAAAARPTAVMALLAQQQTVVLAMDVSGSMQARDVYPDRLTASQQAAKAFVARLPHDVRIGVVAYGGNAHVVQAPTRDREDVAAAIDRFALQPGTAIGTGLVYALATVFPQAGIDVDAIARAGGRRQVVHLDDGATALPQAAPGSYREAAIVLLSDGQNTTGVDPHEAAELAAHLGVRVYTVGFGTPEGDLIAFGGWTVRVRLDEQTLKDVAAITHGEYFRAANEQQLERVYRSMGSRFAMERRETELTALFAAAAAVLLLAGSALSLAWHGKII